MIALAIAFSGLVIALAVLAAGIMMTVSLLSLREMGEMFLLIARANITLELIHSDMEIPEWLKEFNSDGEDESPMAPILELVKKKATEDEEGGP